MARPGSAARRPGGSACMGTWMSRANTRHKPFFFLSQTFLSARTMEVLPSFCSIGTILPPRPAHNECRRAQRRSRMARLRATASAARSVLDGREHGGTLGRVGEPIHTNPTIKKRARKAIKNRDHAHCRLGAAPKSAGSGQFRKLGPAGNRPGSASAATSSHDELGGDTLPLRSAGLTNLSSASTQLWQTEFTYLNVIGGGDSTCPRARRLLAPRAQPLGTRW